jgi:hypothetical protein
MARSGRLGRWLGIELGTFERCSDARMNRRKMKLVRSLRAPVEPELVAPTPSSGRSATTFSRKGEKGIWSLPLHLERLDEGLLRNVHLAELAHALLALLLLVEELALAGDVAAVALGRHVLPEG